MKTPKIGPLRARMNVTQEELARMLGISAMTVHRWEVGQNAPQPMHAATLSMLHEAVKLRGGHVVARALAPLHGAQPNVTIALTRLGDPAVPASAFSRGGYAELRGAR